MNFTSVMIVINFFPPSPHPSRHHKLPMEEDLHLRRTRGSELQIDGYALPTEEDEARMLANRDVDDMAAHRVEHMHAISRHKIHRAASTQSSVGGVIQISGMPGTAQETKAMNKVNELLLYSNNNNNNNNNNKHCLASLLLLFWLLIQC